MHSNQMYKFMVEWIFSVNFLSNITFMFFLNQNKRALIKLKLMNRQYHIKKLTKTTMKIEKRKNGLQILKHKSRINWTNRRKIKSNLLVSLQIYMISTILTLTDSTKYPCHRVLQYPRYLAPSYNLACSFY